MTNEYINFRQLFLLSIYCLLIGTPIGLSAQEEFFSPLALDKNVNKSYKHDFISVVHGPGQVRFEMPLGPGIGARGIHFQPKVVIQPAQKTSSNQSGSCGWKYKLGSSGVYVSSWNSGGAGCLYYNINGALNLAPVLPSSGFSVDWTLPYSYPANEWKVASFIQELGSVTNVMDVGLLTMVPKSFAVQVVLPEGNSCTGYDIPETSIDISQYGNLLSQFGFSNSEYSTYGSRKTSSNGLLFAMRGISGTDISLSDDTAGPATGPGRWVLVRDGIAYEYTFFRFNQNTLPPDNGAEGDAITGDKFNINKFFYELTSIRNKFGDSIKFVYDYNNLFNYTAELYVNGVFTTNKIKGTLAYETRAQNIPNLGSPSSNYPYINPSSLVNIKCETLENGIIVNSWSILGGIRSGQQSRNNDAVTCPAYESNRNLIQPTKITDLVTGYSINIGYQWQTGTLTYGGGINVGCVVINKIDFPGNEIFEFNYSPLIYHAGDDSNADWEPMAWPIQSVDHKDSASNVTRKTQYYRKLPLAKNVLSGDGVAPSIWQNVRQWLNQASYEAEKLPDGKVIVRKFVPPQIATASVPALMTEPERARYDSYMKGDTFEERTLPPNADWETGVLSSDPQVIALRFYDEWDASDNSKIANHPYGVAPDLIVSQSVYSHYYPTRVTSWDAANGIATIERKRGWDSGSNQWSENHQIFIPMNAGSLWTSLGLDHTKLSDSLAGKADTMLPVPGQIDRLVKVTYKALDGYFNFGDWTKKEYFENGITRLPSLIRTSNPKNGATLTEENRSSDGSHIRKEYTYQSDTSGVPNKIVLASDGVYGTDGLVGVSLGYDNLYRLIAVTKLGSTYSSTREFDAMNFIKSITDINNLKHSYQWDSLGRLKAETRPGAEIGANIEYLDDTATTKLTRGIQEGSTIYNAFGEVVCSTKKNSQQQYSHKSFGYDIAGRKVWETIWLDGPGSNLGWDQSMVGFGQKLIYDIFNRVTSSEDANGVVVTNNYTAWTNNVGSIKSINTAPGTQYATSTVYVRDVLGRTVKVIDPLNRVTAYEYDRADRIVTVRQFPTSDAVGSPVSDVARASIQGTGLAQTRFWSYDGLGRLVILDQPESNITYFTSFHILGRPQKTVYGLPRGWRPLDLNAPDNAAFSLANVKTITAEYDTQGRLTSGNASDGSVSQRFTYDELNRGASNGNLTTATSGVVTRSLSYNGLNGRLSNQIIQLPGLDPFSQGIGYDNYGNITTRIYPGNRVQSIAQDLALGMPTGVSHNGINLATFSNDNVSWVLSGLTYGNGVSSVHSYDRDQIRIHRTVHTTGLSTIKDWTYSYDNKGRLDNNAEDWFAYDALDRLTSVVSRDFNPVTLKTNGSLFGIIQKYDYDAFGNRVSLDSKAIQNWAIDNVPPNAPATAPTAKATTYTFNSNDLALSQSNQLPQATLGGVLTGSQYDNQGNLNRIFSVPGDSSSQISLSYDALGRIRSMTDNLHNSIEIYTYDDRGLRTLVEIYQGSVAIQNLQKKKVRIYNENRQLISEYEWVME